MNSGSETKPIDSTQPRSSLSFEPSGRSPRELKGLHIESTSRVLRTTSWAFSTSPTSVQPGSPTGGREGSTSPLGVFHGSQTKGEEGGGGQNLRFEKEKAHPLMASFWGKSQKYELVGTRKNAVFPAPGSAYALAEGGVLEVRDGPHCPPERGASYILATVGPFGSRDKIQDVPKRNVSLFGDGVEGEYQYVAVAIWEAFVQTECVFSI